MPVMLEVSCIISAAAGDWPDFFVILAMVLVNAALGFREEMKAKNALAELTNQMESSIPCRLEMFFFFFFFSPPIFRKIRPHLGHKTF